MQTPKGGLLRGRYRLVEAVGQGGMAVVYRARDEHLGRDVAVKLFRATATDQADIDRQEAEVRLLANLIHHSLVTLLDAGVAPNDFGNPHFFLVMELVEGEDLLKRLQGERPSPRQIAQIGYDIAEGLEYIHHRGIVHRDLKPANILLASYVGDDTIRQAKLTDFGIAKLAGTADITEEGTTMGTAAYLSPEQAKGQPVTGASDVYSLGLVLLECFTGKIAFPGEAVSSAVARLMRNPEIPDELSPEWRELLSAMTARDPKERPSVRDVILALRQIIVTELSRHKAIDEAAVEEKRMEEVRRYEILDTPPDGAFDRVTAMAARLFSVPIAIVSIVDTDRIWFKSHHGLDVQEIGRELGLCASTILEDHPRILEDARRDPAALANPLVAGEFGLQFYAGVPLHTKGGHNLGTLCVLDFEPRVVTEAEIQTLKDLAAIVVNELELRLDSRLAVQALSEGEPATTAAAE